MVVKAEIRALTGLRGDAACLVVVYHFTEGGTGLPSAYLRSFIQHGYLSVDLFFVLSGFVMALNYGSRIHPGRITFGAYGRFLGSRIGRTYPLYVVATVACVALAAVGLPEFPQTSNPMIVANLLLVQAWGFGDTICGPAWSISTEFGAYLLLPVLLWFTMAKGLWRPIATLCLIVAAYVALTFLGTGQDKKGLLDIYTTRDGGEMLRCLAGFTSGLLSYRAATQASIWQFSGRPLVGFVIMIMVVVLMALPGTDLAIVVLFGPLVVSLATEAGVAARFLAIAPVMWLGIISYSIYLVHFPLARALRPIIQPMLGSLERFHASGLILLVATLAVSTLTYYLIERPARDLSRRLLGRPALPQDLALASPTQP